jgi:hypothetical protein
MDRERMKEQILVLRNKRLKSSQTRVTLPPPPPAPKPVVRNKVVMLSTPTPAKNDASPQRFVKQVNPGCGRCSRKLNG